MDFPGTSGLSRALFFFWCSLRHVNDQEPKFLSYMRATTAMHMRCGARGSVSHMQPTTAMRIRREVIPFGLVRPGSRLIYACNRSNAYETWRPGPRVSYASNNGHAYEAARPTGLFVLAFVSVATDAISGVLPSDSMVEWFGCHRCFQPGWRAVMPMMLAPRVATGAAQCYSRALMVSR